MHYNFIQSFLLHFWDVVIFEELEFDHVKHCLDNVGYDLRID